MDRPLALARRIPSIPLDAIYGRRSGAFGYQSVRPLAQARQAGPRNVTDGESRGFGYQTIRPLAQARRTGLGLYTPPDIFESPSVPIGSVDNDPDWWEVLIPVAGQTISNVYAPWQTRAAQAQQLQAPAYVPTQYAGAYRAPSSGVGVGVDSQGIRLSDGSHIGWGTIAVVVVGFTLLQSKGFSRR